MTLELKTRAITFTADAFANNQSAALGIYNRLMILKTILSCLVWVRRWRYRQFTRASSQAGNPKSLP